MLSGPHKSRQRSSRIPAPKACHPTRTGQAPEMTLAQYSIDNPRFRPSAQKRPSSVFGLGALTARLRSGPRSEGTVVLFTSSTMLPARRILDSPRKL